MGSPGFTERIDSSGKESYFAWQRDWQLRARVCDITRLRSPRSTRNCIGFDIFSNCAISPMREKHGNALVMLPRAYFGSPAEALLYSL
jgi:hypothetical protein